MPNTRSKAKKNSHMKENKSSLQNKKKSRQNKQLRNKKNISKTQNTHGIDDKVPGKSNTKIPIAAKIKKLGDYISHQNYIKQQKRTLRTDQVNFFRLLQLFPNFKPIFIQKIYIQCKKSILRTIDNILYLKRYCSYLYQVKQLKPLAEKTCIANNLNIPNSYIQGNANMNSSPDYIPNGSIEGINEQIRKEFPCFTYSNFETKDQVLPFEWNTRKCQTPQLESPKYTSSPILFSPDSQWTINENGFIPI